MSKNQIAMLLSALVPFWAIQLVTIFVLAEKVNWVAWWMVVPLVNIAVITLILKTVK